MKDHVTVEEWLGMFRESGVDEERSMRWHRLFESRYPDAHQGFLEWLGIKPEEIARIRAQCR